MDNNTAIYTGECGFNTRKFEFESKRNDGEVVRILHFSDVHINYTNEEDIENDEIMYTVECRHWNAGGLSIRPLRRIMEYAKKFDQTIITGDTLDYLTCGAMELMQKYIWDVDPECLVAIGGHDITRQMQTKRPNVASIEERRQTVADFWKHDIYYTSKVIKDKVMAIVLNNGEHRYFDCQVEKLEEDIKKARENGYIILVFQHEPISTGNPDDTETISFKEYDGIDRNFYDIPVGDFEKYDEVTRKVYRLLTQNADVIKGFFCGHYHSCFYTEVCASYKDEKGDVHNVMLPQVNSVPIVYDDCKGHVVEITVK